MIYSINADCLISCYVIINEGLGVRVCVCVCVCMCVCVCVCVCVCLGPNPPPPPPPPPDPILIFKVLYWQLLIVAFILLTVCGCKHECSPIAWHGSCVLK